MSDTLNSKVTPRKEQLPLLIRLTPTIVYSLTQMFSKMYLKDKYSLIYLEMLSNKTDRPLSYRLIGQKRKWYWWRTKSYNLAYLYLQTDTESNVLSVGIDAHGHPLDFANIKRELGQVFPALSIELFFSANEPYFIG